LLRVFRICKSKLAATAFSGEGARLEGGRWNDKGTRLVYCSSSVSLAMLELLANTPALPVGMVSLELTLPDDVAVDTWSVKDLPPRWNAFPAPATLKARGSAWVASGRTVALWVPSAVVPGEANLLINPQHADFGRCHVAAPKSITFDSRLKPKP
jgi:RES domain-containing protein